MKKKQNKGCCEIMWDNRDKLHMKCKKSYRWWMIILFLLYLGLICLILSNLNKLLNWYAAYACK